MHSLRTITRLHFVWDNCSHRVRMTRHCARPTFIFLHCHIFFWIETALALLVLFGGFIACETVTEWTTGGLNMKLFLFLFYILIHKNVLIMTYWNSGGSHFEKTLCCYTLLQNITNLNNKKRSYYEEKIRKSNENV